MPNDQTSEAAGIAEEFHATYETLAPAHGYKTRKASAVAWDAVPPDNQALMIATVQHLLDAGVIQPGDAIRRAEIHAETERSQPPTRGR